MVQWQHTRLWDLWILVRIQVSQLYMKLKILLTWSACLRFPPEVTVSLDLTVSRIFWSCLSRGYPYYAAQPPVMKWTPWTGRTWMWSWSAVILTSTALTMAAHWSVRCCWMLVTALVSSHSPTPPTLLTLRDWANHCCSGVSAPAQLIRWLPIPPHSNHENAMTSPGGISNRRPDRATIAYTNLIRRNFKNTRPIVLGGIEASLRRISHYDYWTNKIRGSVLLDAKADYLLYGMADRSILEFAAALKNQEPVTGIRGLCYIASEPPSNALVLPSLEEVRAKSSAFIEAFRIFYENSDSIQGKRLAQKQEARWLIQNPPAQTLTREEMDAVYALPFTRQHHPFYEAQGKAPAMETIRFSVVTHRGCYGECNFCAITVHEGRTVQWRSEKSILAEIEALTKFHLRFKGNHPRLKRTGHASMYGFECRKKLQSGACKQTLPVSTALFPIDNRPFPHLLAAFSTQNSGVKKFSSAQAFATIWSCTIRVQGKVTSEKW